MASTVFSTIGKITIRSEKLQGVHDHVLTKRKPKLVLLKTRGQYAPFFNKFPARKRGQYAPFLGKRCLEKGSTSAGMAVFFLINAALFFIWARGVSMDKNIQMKGVLIVLLIFV